MLQLNFKKYGQGKPLIILHGFLGSLDNWHTIANEFGKSGFEVFTIDLRNHGRSPHTFLHSIPLMADDLNDFMEQQNLSSANIIGHSMGGKVAMQFALSYQKKVDKLIVVDIAPREYTRGHDDVFAAIKNIELGQIQTRKEAEEKMFPYLTDLSTRQFILKNLERSEEGNYHWKFNFETLYREYENMLVEINSVQTFNGKTLFIKGSNSNYIQEKDRNDIEKIFPNVIIKSIEKSGHWVHADNPKEFFETVINFLN